MQAAIVAQDSDLGDYLSYLLRRAGFEVSFRPSLETLLKHWNERPVDIILLREPDTAATLTDLCNISDAFVIVLTEQHIEDRTAALLHAGADLVLPLPIGPKVLLAYIQSLLRRSDPRTTSSLPSIDLGSISLNTASRTVKVFDRPPSSLTQLEFRLLHLLMTHPGQVMPPDMIVDRVWGYGESGSKELVRGLVSRVRAKIEPQPGEPIFIRTLPGVGYIFESRS